MSPRYEGESSRSAVPTPEHKADRSAEIVRAVGPRLRAARIRAGLSQREVAERAGLSKSFVRLVEAGNSDISLARLLGWMMIFGMTVADLFGDESHPNALVTHPADRVAVPLGEAGVDFYLLAPEVHTALEPGIFVLRPGAKLKRPLQHAGEEALFVVRGHVRLLVGDHSEELSQGDAAYYRSTLPHRFENLSGREVAELLVTANHRSLPGPAG